MVPLTPILGASMVMEYSDGRGEDHLNPDPCHTPLELVPPAVTVALSASIFAENRVPLGKDAHI
jgi:hypothetical protein